MNATKLAVLSSCVYGLGLLEYLALLFGDNGTLRRLATGTLALGLLTQVVGALRGGAPYAQLLAHPMTFAATVGILAFVTVACFLVLEWRANFRWAGPLAAASACAFTLVGAFALGAGGSAIGAVIQGKWGFLQGALAAFGYSGFVIAALSGVLLLIQSRRRKEALLVATSFVAMVLLACAGWTELAAISSSSRVLMIAIAGFGLHLLLGSAALLTALPTPKPKKSALGPFEKFLGVIHGFYWLGTVAAFAWIGLMILGHSRIAGLSISSGAGRLGLVCLAGLAALVMGVYAARSDSIDDSLPTPEVLDRISERAASFGFFFFTVALASGCAWRLAFRGRIWGWDAGEAWVLAIWLFYSACLVRRMDAAGERDGEERKIALASVAGLFLVFLGMSHVG